MNNINQIRTFLDFKRICGHIDNYEYQQLTIALNELEGQLKELTERIENMTLGGFMYQELIEVKRLLDAKLITPDDLSDRNKALKKGYELAMEDVKKFQKGAIE